MSDDFYSFYGSQQKTEEPKAEPEVKKSSSVQARKITNAPSASVPTPVAAERPLDERDLRQIDQPALVQQAQAGLQQAGPPQAPSAIDAMSATGKDLLPYLLTGGGTLVASKLWDMFSKKDGGGGGGGGGPSASSGPSYKDQIEAEKLKQAQIKTAREELLHQNFVAKNTLTESEQLFGRKAKDAAELRLMDTAYEQQKPRVAGASVPPAATPPAPVAPAPTVAPVAPAATAPVVAPTLAPTTSAPAPAPIQPANVVSTGPTPEAASERIKKAAEIKKVVEPPPSGMKPQYTKKKGEIGPGGYNWFASQVGHEVAPARWEEQYGKTNVPHEQVQRDYQATRYPPTPKTIEGRSGGAFGKPEFIPEHIRGSSSSKMLAATAALAAIPSLAAAGYQSYKGNKEAVDSELKDAWESIKSTVTMPYDVVKAANKGDFGPLKDLAMGINPATLLMNEVGKRDESAIQKMIQSEKANSKKGIAPPSAYMR